MSLYRTLSASLTLVALAGCPSQKSVTKEEASAPSAQTNEKPSPGEEKMATTQPAATGFHAFVMKDIDGQDKSLSEYQGKAVLVVNVASQCGYTPQYVGLQKLYSDYKDKGLVVLGVPSNDFGKQEPGSEAEIKEFCSTNFHVTFPMLAKVSVKNGPEQSDLYKYLTQKQQNGNLDAEVAWNFNKFLISKDGKPLKHYESKVKPDDPQLIADIESAIK